MNLDVVTLVAGGQIYSGWTEFEFTRGINRTVSSVTLSASNAPGSPIVAPFQPCQIYIDSDLLMTGYLEEVAPEFDAATSKLRIIGHSKTKDLTDCTPDINSGQFSGFTVAAIVRSVTALFGVDVVVQTDQANQVVQNTNLQRGETAFAFLSRLCNLAGVLLSDDEQGRLVMSIAGSAKSGTALVQGQNILGGHGVYNAAKRFSDYIVKGQASIADGSALDLSGAGGIPGSPVGQIQTGLRALAKDTDVPRYRPHVTLAESPLTPAQMQLRANWQKQFAYGQSMKLTVRRAGFRQDDGTLWKPNLMVSLTAPTLYAANDLLIAEVKFHLDAASRGHVTELLVGPVEGYTPDPGSVKIKKEATAKGGGGGGGGTVGRGGKGGGGLNLSGAGGIP